MSSKNCCIVCNYKSFKNGGKRSLHKFPSEVEKLEKWKELMCISSKCLNENSRICSAHFDLNSFAHSNGSRQRLTSDAYPTLNPCEMIIENSEVRKKLFSLSK